MDISISFEALMGMNWPLWKELVPKLDDMGFHTVYQSDHFYFPPSPQVDSLELITSLTFLAAHTRRIRFGSMVAPLSFRDPVMLARQAMSLNDLSGGRMILGLGSGWMEEEHARFGYHLGSKQERMDRFAEGLEVISRLTRSNQPQTFSGQYFRLEDARLMPYSQPKLLVGGNGPRRTLPLAARYADVWNGLPQSPEDFRASNAQLDDLIRAAGRQPGEVKRTITKPVVCWETPADHERIRQHFLATFPFLSDSPDTSAHSMAAAFNGFGGTTEEVIRQLEAYADAGAEEFVIQWGTVRDIESLQIFANQIIPHFMRQLVS